MQSEFYVNEKRVKLRERVPLKDAPNLPVILRAIDDDLRNIAKLGVIMIEEWEFDGSPRDRRSYEELDIPSELMPLGRHMGEYLSNRMDVPSPKR